MIDLNHQSTKQRGANDAINAAIDAALTSRPEKPRDYLGASAIGYECLRKIQWDWTKSKPIDAQLRRIFDRGHIMERYVADLFLKAGFRLQQGGPQTAFSQLDGKFKGHGDGIFFGGPALPNIAYPALWEMKALGDKGWNSLDKKGLKDAYPHYWRQVQTYMAYFGLSQCIFTALNSNTMALVHLTIPFDAPTAQSASDSAVTIIKATAAGETLPRITDKPDDFRCRFCAHRDACWNV